MKTNRTYVVVTRWVSDDGATFDRTHERMASSRHAAIAAELAHTMARLADENFAKTWRAEIVRCVLVVDAPTITQADFDALSCDS